MTTTKSNVAKPASPTKKPYQSPGLVVYGDIGQITQAQSHSGMLDGATMSLKTG